jgi:adenine-specific DNA-methyltransferase
METKHSLGQYFTSHELLKHKVQEFIQNEPSCILEPSVGRGDLIETIYKNNTHIQFDMYEIDTTLTIIDGIPDNIIYGDFMKQTISKTYQTIIGNPPYVRTKKGNLYIDFTEKCYNLLDTNGELIFIVPSDFLKLTGASKLLNTMMTNGSFTHIFHPHNENLFEGASIDVIVFRYCKNNSIEKKVLYNNELLYIINSDGLITFEKEQNNETMLIKDCFDIYVGLVTGKEEVYKNEELGNIEVLNGENKTEKYIYIEDYPCNNEKINTHLLKHKNVLINRKIKTFSENNWFEWGAPRNIVTMKNNIGKECIYIYNLTRRTDVSFVGKINYFGGSLIMLKPKKKYNLNNIVSYFNSDNFKNNFIFSGRFKIGHRQISNSYIPTKYLHL